MEDFTKPFSPKVPDNRPQSSVNTPQSPKPQTYRPANNHQVFFENLSFGDKFSLSWRLTVSNALSYILPFLAGMFAAGMTFYILLMPVLVGLSSIFLRQIDGDTAKATIGEVFNPMNRFGRLFLFSLLFLGIYFGVFIVMFIFSMMSMLLGDLGVILYVIIQLVQFVISFFLTLLMICASFYLAEYDAGPGEAMGAAWRLLTNNLGQWLGALVSVMLFSVPVIIVFMVAFVALIFGMQGAIDPNTGQVLNSGLLGGTVVGMIILFIVYMVAMAFIYVFSQFIYGINYRQLMPSASVVFE